MPTNLIRRIQLPDIPDPLLRCYVVLPDTNPNFIRGNHYSPFANPTYVFGQINQSLVDTLVDNSPNEGRLLAPANEFNSVIIQNSQNLMRNYSLGTLDRLFGGSCATIASLYFRLLETLYIPNHTGIMPDCQTAFREQLLHHIGIIDIARNHPLFPFNSGDAVDDASTARCQVLNMLKSAYIAKVFMVCRAIYAARLQDDYTEFLCFHDSQWLHTGIDDSSIQRLAYYSALSMDSESSREEGYDTYVAIIDHIPDYNYTLRQEETSPRISLREATRTSYMRSQFKILMPNEDYPF